MTRFTPLWQQAGSYPANYDRALLATMWPAPAATGAAATTVSNTMNVSIPAGSLAVPLQSGQHTALCRWDAAEIVTSQPAPAAGNSRIDVVVCQVRDPQLDAGVNNDFVFVVLAGAPATSNPVAPTVPVNAAPVCSYTVVGGSANLNGVTITDLRRGTGIRPVFASTTERDTVWPNPPPGSICQAPAPYIRLGGAWRGQVIAAPQLFKLDSAPFVGSGLRQILSCNLGWSVPFATVIDIATTFSMSNDSVAMTADLQHQRQYDGTTYTHLPAHSAPFGSWMTIALNEQIPIGAGGSLYYFVNSSLGMSGGTGYVTVTSRATVISA